MDQQAKPALLIIDMINDFNFSHGEILSKKAEEITGSILALKDRFKQKEWPVIYINDHFNLWQADFKKIIDHCRNERSEKVIEQIAPDDGDYFLIKPKHSAFYGTALNTLLQQLKADSLVITGVAGNICVLFTANDAYMREYSLSIPQNCIASNSDKDNKYALTMMEEVLKADTRSSTEIFNQ
ncbi:isochorismatase family cysteine hydrolase [Mesobacillus foraminis]|uniref:isochorismatase family cysteine hydrolase n=1 Tax=Mesobacillus foraminis TaxID=279826 RepID=UPI000EF49BD1